MNRENKLILKEGQQHKVKVRNGIVTKLKILIRSEIKVNIRTKQRLTKE